MSFALSQRRALASKVSRRSAVVRAQVPQAEVKTAQSGKEYVLTLPGIVAPTGFFDPAGFTDSPAFTHFQEVEKQLPQFWEIILLAIGVTEATRIALVYSNIKDNLASQQIKEDHIPGDLNFDPLGLYPTDAAAQLDIKNKELSNGRLAMIAIAGFAAQEEVDHITIWKGLVKENIVPKDEANLFN